MPEGSIQSNRLQSKGRESRGNRRTHGAAGLVSPMGLRRGGTADMKPGDEQQRRAESPGIREKLERRSRASAVPGYGKASSR